MTTLVILAFAVVLLGGLLSAEKKESLKGILLTKPLLSGLFIATALAQSHPAGAYFYLILTGLVLCLAGDICLACFFNRRSAAVLRFSSRVIWPTSRRFSSPPGSTPGHGCPSQRCRSSPYSSSSDCDRTSFP